MYASSVVGDLERYVVGDMASRNNSRGKPICARFRSKSDSQAVFRNARSSNMPFNLRSNNTRNAYFVILMIVVIPLITESMRTTQNPFQTSLKMLENKTPLKLLICKSLLT